LGEKTQLSDESASAARSSEFSEPKFPAGPERNKAQGVNMNTFKTFLLMAALLVLFIVIGGAIGGRQGMVTAFMLGAVMNFFSYWFSDKIVLMMYGAKETTEAESPKIFEIVKKLTAQAGLPMPKVYLMNSPMPNAFATGRNYQHSAVAVTSGILELLTPEELMGVLAHELAHIRNRDILTSTMAATIAGAIFMLARMAQWGMMFGGRDRDNNNGNAGLIMMLVVAIIAPIAAMLIQMAISRSREYQADADGAAISNNPLALASALKKLTSGVKKHPLANPNPTTAHMFIVSPLSGKAFLNLFSTHPPMEQRIARLEKLAGQIEAKKYNIPKVVY
jgi:heat shock protein HtpX